MPGDKGPCCPSDTAQGVRGGPREAGEGETGSASGIQNLPRPFLCSRSRPYVHVPNFTAQLVRDKWISENHRKAPNFTESVVVPSSLRPHSGEPSKTDCDAPVPTTCCSRPPCSLARVTRCTGKFGDTEGGRATFCP